MKKICASLFILFLSGQAWACPGCVGSNPQDKYLVYILGAFILLTYIPFFFLFRMINKNKNAHTQHLTPESAAEVKEL